MAASLLRKQLKGAPAAFRDTERTNPRQALAALPAELTKNPVDGFSAGLVDDSNVFEWQVTIIGPPETL